MGEEPRDVGAQVAGADDPETIRVKIEETRQELGDTVAELSRRTDVKARTREKVEDARATVAEKADEIATKAHDAMPPAAQERVSDLSQRVRRDPRRALAVVGAAVGALLVLLRRRGRG